MNIDPTGEAPLTFAAIIAWIKAHAAIIAAVVATYLGNAYFNADENGTWQWNPLKWNTFLTAGVSSDGESITANVGVGPLQANHTFNNTPSNGDFGLNGYQGNSSNQSGVSTGNEGSNTTIGPNINSSGIMTGGSGGFVNNNTTNGGEAEDGEDDTTVVPNENLDPNDCTEVLVCPQGQVFDGATCSCKVKCPTTFGYLYTNALPRPLSQGLVTVIETDNFRDAAGAIIADTNCDTGKIFKGQQVNLLSIFHRIRTFIREDGSIGEALYFPIEFTNCNGNLPANEDYDPEKPCGDCDKANPLVNMNDLQNTPSGTANPEHRHGGDYGWTRIRRDYINLESGDNYHKFHSGYDIAGAIGTPIYAVHNGTVDALIDSHPNDVNNPLWQTNGVFDYDKYTDWREVQSPPLAINAGGNKIKIGWTENGSYFSHNYEHLQQGTILVSAGDVVTKGQLIGYIGITGNAQTSDNGGSHLHFSKYDATGAIDPSEDILANYNDDGHDDDPCDDN